MVSGVGKIQLTKSWRVEDSSPFCFSIKFQFGPEKRYSAPSPIIEMKAQKNDVEIRGMVEAHLRDAVIFCDAMAFIEDQVSVHKTVSWETVRLLVQTPGRPRFQHFISADVLR